MKRTRKTGSVLSRDVELFGGESQDGREDEGQKEKPESHAHPAIESLGNAHNGHKGEYQSDKGNDAKKKPPPWLARDLKKNNRAVDGDNNGPTRLARFGVKHPKRYDHDEDQNQFD